MLNDAILYRATYRQILEESSNLDLHRKAQQVTNELMKKLEEERKGLPNIVEFNLIY